MQPTIEAYNHMVNADSPLGCLDVWQTINNVIPGLEPSCDLNKFTELYFTLKEILKTVPKENVYIGVNHSELYDILSDDLDKKITMYNVDHHHDLGYMPMTGDEDVTVANWMYKLNQTHKVNRYIWISNANSRVPLQETIDTFKHYTNTNDLKVVKGVKFDKIFICGSWEWVPPKYRNLFNILVSLIDYN